MRCRRFKLCGAAPRCDPEKRLVVVHVTGRTVVARDTCTGKGAVRIISQNSITLRNLGWWVDLSDDITVAYLHPNFHTPYVARVAADGGVIVDTGTQKGGMKIARPQERKLGALLQLSIYEYKKGMQSSWGNVVDGFSAESSVFSIDSYRNFS